MTVVALVVCSAVGSAAFLWLWTLVEDWGTFTVADTTGIVPGSRIGIDGTRYSVVRVQDAQVLVVVRRYHAPLWGRA